MDTTLPSVAAVVVTYNGLDCLPDCLESLRPDRAAEGLRAVVLVDNGSSDGTAEWVARSHPEVDVVGLDHNLGFAGGANRGIERALSAGAAWIFLLNNDASVRPGLMRRLLDVAEVHPEASAFAPTILFEDRPEVICSAGIALTSDGGARDVLSGEPVARAEGPVREVFGPTAGAALFRRSFFEEVGLFEPRLFAYFEDVDLAWRARHKGVRTLYVPDAFATHTVARTSGASSLSRLFLLQRNRLQVAARNLPGAGRALRSIFRASTALLPRPSAIARARASSPFFRAHAWPRQAAVYAAAWAAAAWELPRLLTERRRILSTSCLGSAELEWWLRNDFRPLSWAG